MNPSANPDSIARRVRGSIWRMVDRSDTGCRLIAPIKEAPTRLGELVAIKEGEHWMLAVVRRMQRQQVDEVTVGVEIIAKRIVRVLMRSWMAPVDTSQARRRAAVLRHLSARRIGANRQNAQRSLIGPDDRFAPGGMVELDTGNARYLIRFSQTLERQAGWSVGAVQRGAQALGLDRAAVASLAARNPLESAPLPARDPPLLTQRARIGEDCARHPSADADQRLIHRRQLPTPFEEKQWNVVRSSSTPACAGILAAGTAPAFAQGRPKSSGASRRAFPRASTRSSARAETICQARSRRRPSGKFQIQVFAGGEIVPAFGVVDAVQNGTVECGHTAPYYFFGKDPTFAFGCAIPFGMNHRQQNAWMYHGGGMELMREFSRTTTSSTSRPATPARRWAAGSARRSRPSPT